MMINSLAFKQRHFGKATALKWWLKRKPSKGQSTVVKSSTGWTTGSKHLSSTSAYTWLFSVTAIRAWEDDYKKQLAGKNTYKPQFTLQELFDQMPFGRVPPPLPDLSLITPRKTRCPKKANDSQTNTLSRYFAPRTFENETSEIDSTDVARNLLIFSNPALYALKCLGD